MTDLQSTLAAIDEHLLVEQAAAHALGSGASPAFALLSIELRRLKVAILVELLRFWPLRPVAEELITREWRRIDPSGSR